MKVIKSTQLPKDWKQEVECLVCHSLLEIEAADLQVKKIESDYQMPEDFYDVSIRCPECHQRVSVNEAIDQDTAKKLFWQQENRWMLYMTRELGK